MRIRIIGGFQDTRTNHEDLALTPYIAVVNCRPELHIYGLSFTWVYYSWFIAIGINIPKEMKSFRSYRWNGKK